ncbi:hypothetical protein Tco_1517551 [Tanacetum coccineum]
MKNDYVAMVVVRLGGGDDDWWFHLLPKCEELERVVGGRNWLDMMIVYFDEYAYEQRKFTRRLNGLIGEMNEACADRMAFVQELWSVAGESVHAKTVREIVDKEGLAWQINALCDTLTTVIDGRWAFIEELEMLAYKFVPGKMTEFMKEIQDKDISNLMKSIRWLGSFQSSLCFFESVACWSKRALFADVPRCLSDSSLFFAEPVVVLWLGGGVTTGHHRVRCAQRLARAADYDDIRDQLLVLFTREVAEDTKKMENYRQLSNQLRNDVRMRDIYIRELRTSDISDKVVESIEILKRVQLDDMEKASRLLLMAREIQSKVFEKNTFIARLRD